jgi:lantibiotic modifying enzyme
MAVALTETYRTGGQVKYRHAAERCFDFLGRDARRQGSGVTWGQTTDMISGSAGIGLTLLYAGDALDLDWTLELAVAAGLRLLELGRVDSGGLKWPMSPEYERLMPNFSHGTAGVCHFLATLYGKTGEAKFLDAAIAGGRYLQSIANTDDGGCLVFHHEPGGEDLYYLSWCHGPAGTARFFYRLAEATGDNVWMTWVHRCAHALVDSGIPEHRNPGFWNNVSQCCGDAGVGEFLLALVRRTGDPAYWDFADRIVRSVDERATTDVRGTRWVQAEHRTRPELLVAQTGFMQGAAGICTFLLHMDEFERGKQAAIILPDNPFV